MGCALGMYSGTFASGTDPLAAYGEVHFEAFGFICQASAVVVSCSLVELISSGLIAQFESSRLVMIQILLQGLKVRCFGDCDRVN